MNSSLAYTVVMGASRALSESRRSRVMACEICVLSVVVTGDGRFGWSKGLGGPLCRRGRRQ